MTEQLELYVVSDKSFLGETGENFGYDPDADVASSRGELKVMILLMRSFYKGKMNP